MRVVTVRLDENEVEALDQEADERGFGNRTEYIRWILRNRDGIDVNAAARLEDLEQRVADLEDREQ